MTNPLLRARHIRWRLLRLLDDAQAGRAASEQALAASGQALEASEQARDQLPALGDAVLNIDRGRVAQTDAFARIQAQLEANRATIGDLRDAVERLSDQTRRQGRVLELLYEEDGRNERMLRELRESAPYADPFTEPEPLVSVTIPTYRQYERLLDRALPSVFAQTYRNLEVVIVGDGAPEETGRLLEELGDERVRYENLTVRAPYPEDPVEFWYVAGTTPWNRAWQLARGSWIAPLNDDDAFRPDHIELLLDAARRERCEVAYGAAEHHRPDGETEIVNSWPPESHEFGWQTAVVHAGLRFLGMQHGAGALGVPGDWSLCRRMRRAGVRFTCVEDVVVDYFPSGAWSPERFG